MRFLNSRSAVVIAFTAALLAPVPTHADDLTMAGRMRLAPGLQGTRNANEQTERVTRTFKLGPNGQVDLANISGDITVTAGGAGDVTLEVVKVARGRSEADAREQLGLVQVEISERPGRAEARTRYPRSERRSTNVSVRYTVTAPPGTTVEARSISGSVRITGITGPVNAESISGDVRIEKGGRVERAKSISGTVDIQGVKLDGTLEASSVSGDVRIRDVDVRRLELGSVSGDVEVGEVTCQTAELKSTSGDVEYTGALQTNGRYEFRSHSGTVRVTLSGDVGFQLEASSFSGSIDTELPITIGGTGGGRASRRALRGVYGDGGATLELTTFSGNVIIRKR